MKEVIEANGGIGVYYFPQREEFKLENPDWKYDVWPEIMDGKNVYDFVDKDILAKVEALEKEELIEKEKGLGLDDDEGMKDEDEDEDEESSELDDDLIEAHDKLMQNVKTIKERHKLVKRSRIPVKLGGQTATDKFMEEVRPDLKEKAEKVKMLSYKLRREQKDKLRNSLKKEAGVNEEDEKVEEDDEMDIDEENQNTKKKKKVSEKESVKVKQEKNKIVQRLQKKIQKKFDKNLQINETDRRIGDKKPRFFNSGKRGIGKTDWR
jgi:nucleolar GTP-binding protein